MQSLYEISVEYQRSFLALAELEDVDAQTIDDTLEAMEGTFELKAHNVAKFFQNLDAEAAMIKEAEQRMASRRKAIENKAERMRLYLKKNMISTGITKISCPFFALSIQKTADKVVIDDPSLIPDEFIRTKIIKEPDKIAIKAAGGCIGARIEPNFTLRIK